MFFKRIFKKKDTKKITLKVDRGLGENYERLRSDLIKLYLDYPEISMSLNEFIVYFETNVLGAGVHEFMKEHMPTSQSTPDYIR